MRIGFLVGVFLFVSGEGLFRFGVCFIIALFFYSFLIISLVRLLFTYGRLIHCIKLILPFFFTGRNCLDACSRCALEHDSLNGRIFKDLDIGVAAGRNGHLGSFDKGAANKPHRSKKNHAANGSTGCTSNGLGLLFR